MKIKEILVLHHSHFDLGYTHSQPILWELQREFIDGALDLLQATEDFPAHARPRWTVEVTAQVLKWLETASDADVERFRRYAQEKRIGISAMLCHVTPLCTAEQLIRQLQPIKRLRETFGITINTVNQHDINGVPWSMVDLMLDAGIELFIMAINRHLGGFATERPAVIRWEGPSGRAIKTMNGAHYTMFDQIMDTHLNDLDAMRKGLDHYLDFLEKEKKYRHDFIYLTTANAPVCYDNSPPNIDVANLIRRWNAEGFQPLMRYVTPGMLLERIEQLPDTEMPLHAGDWTDFWNFGCASNAVVTQTNLQAKPRLFTRDMIAATAAPERAVMREIAEKAWLNLNYYDEHTWGSYNSMYHDNSFTRTQSHLKDALAYQARELADYLAVDALEALSANPPQADEQGGVLLVNSGPEARTEYIPIPDEWWEDGKRLRTARFGWTKRYEDLEKAGLYGPVTLAPFSWQIVPLKDLQVAENNSKVTHGRCEQTLPRIDNKSFDTIIRERYFIESPFHRLEYEQPTGRIVRLYDKEQDWEVLDENSEWTFFEYAYESPDPLIDSGRTSYYKRSMKKEKFDVNCWDYHWRARREHATRPLGMEVREHPRGITLVLHFEAPGLDALEQHITLQGETPLIELSARMRKKDIRTPEGLYFVFPLNLSAGWRSHFNTAGVPLELDAEQLPGCSRDWVTVETFASVSSKDYSAILYCPEAPMVQVGDFRYGRGSAQIERPENPLLLAWPLNSYWDTNFRASQPGWIEVRYAFRSTGAFQLSETVRESRTVFNPIEVHPAINGGTFQEGHFCEIDHPDVDILHVKPAMDGAGAGAVFRLINLSGKTVKVKLRLPGKKLTAAVWTNPLEEDGENLSLQGDTVEISLPPRKISGIKVFS